MRILIIEDDLETRDFLKSALEAETYAVDATSDGEKGSYMARTNDYDLIILDNNLPKKNGKEICLDVRNAKKNIPILILSVLGEYDKKVDLLDTGADDYLTKPFSFQELLARIRALMRRPTTLTENIITIDDLVLDTIKQTVKRDKKGIYLTRKEFSLLEYLMRNKGKVVSRGTIMEHVWNIDTDPFSNTIEAHILNIRKKIRGHRKPELIHNVPGRGYKIDLIK
jgi:DNA-binding response OmpR family regulator